MYNYANVDAVRKTDVPQDHKKAAEDSVKQFSEVSYS